MTDATRNDATAAAARADCSERDPALDPDRHNSRLSPTLVGAFRELTGQRIRFAPAGPKENLLMQGREELRGLADRVICLAEAGERELWVLATDWHADMDRPEFLLVGFAAGGVIDAMGWFDRWPESWSRSDPPPWAEKHPEPAERPG